MVSFFTLLDCWNKAGGARERTNLEWYMHERCPAYTITSMHT